MRKKSVLLNKAEKSRRSKDCFGISHGDAEIEVCSAGFRSSFRPVIPHYALFLSFWNHNVCSEPWYVI